MAFLPTIVLGAMQTDRRFRPIRSATQGLSVFACIACLTPIGLRAQSFSMWYASDCFCSHTGDIAHDMQTDSIFRMYPEVSRAMFPDSAHTTDRVREESAYEARPVVHL